MTPLVLAPALQPGSTIAFVSLSARLNNVFPAAIERATDLLTSRGFKVRVFFNTDSGLRSSIDNRMSEFRAAFLDPEISAVICTIGGGSFTELLPSLIADVELHKSIREQPKVVVGYSDMTGLHWFLHGMTGLRTFYGPSAIPELGNTESVDDETSTLAFCVKYMFEAISKPQPLGDIPRSPTYAAKMPDYMTDPNSTKVPELSPAPEWKWLRPGKGQGRLFGGCVTVVPRLNGIRALAPDWHGRIVFLESHAGTAEDFESLQTAFADLVAQGVFDEAAGLVVGRPFGYDSDEGRADYERVITQLLCEGPLGKVEKSFPILFNVDFGHTTPMVTLPFDVLAELDSEQDRFTLLEAGVA